MLLSSVLVIASSAPLVLDGGVRVRSHIVQHHNATDHNPQLQSRLGILWGKNKPFGGKLVLQDARRLSEMTSSQAGDLMLHQGYASAQLRQGVRLDVGRRSLSLGSQRLVSHAAWSDSGRAFDGIFLTLKDPRYPVAMTAWATQPGTPGSMGKRFAGVYLERSALPSLHLEAWWMRKQTLSAQHDRHTVGAAARLKRHNLSAEFEGSYQFGDQAERSIAAWGGALQAQWRATQNRLKPVLGAELNLVSGDTSDDDQVDETFDSLYAAEHRYWGHLDLMGGRNAMDIHVWAGARLAKTDISIHGHLLSLHSAADDFYLRNGSGRGLDLGQDSARDVGAEIDLVAHKKYGLFSVKTGLSVFLPGTVAKASDLGVDPIIGGYIQLESRFK